MFSDIVVEHSDEINVALNEKNTQTDETSPQHPTFSRKPSLKCKTQLRVNKKKKIKMIINYNNWLNII